MRLPKTPSPVTNLLLIAGFLAVVAFIYFAAAPPSDEVNGKILINYWTGWSGREFEPLQKIIDEYNARHDDVYIKTTYVGGSYHKMRIAFAGGDTPDVCSSVWGYDIPDYAIRGALTPLDEWVAHSTRKSEDYPEMIWRIFQYDGHIYALSDSISTVFIAYNKKVFREVGLDPENPPRTLEEFDRAAELCTKYRNNHPAEGIQRLGFAYPGCLLYWSNAFNVDYWDPAQKKVLFDSPQMHACLNWLKQNVDKSGFDRQRAFISTFGNTLSPNNPFFSNKVAMVIAGDWYKTIIELYAPPDFEWGWFPFPTPAGGRVKSSILDASMFVIPSASKHKKEAWDFLLYITSPYMQRNFRLGDSPAGFPAMKCVFQDADYRTPYWQFVGDLIESPGANSPKVPLFNKFLFLLNRVEESVLSGEATAPQATRRMRVDLQAAIDEVFKSYSATGAPQPAPQSE